MRLRCENLSQRMQENKSMRLLLLQLGKTIPLHLTTYTFSGFEKVLCFIFLIKYNTSV